MQAIENLISLYLINNPTASQGDRVYLCTEIESVWQCMGLKPGCRPLSVMLNKESAPPACLLEEYHKSEEHLHLFLDVLVDIYESREDSPVRKGRIIAYRRLIRLFEKCGIDTSTYCDLYPCFKVAYGEEFPETPAEVIA